ncbi:response regulator transcription factor [Pseudanabaena sp. FACHB-2040]|uniref:response regulator transcription factor n=1 Tax=Pseudanabaena sp. FACHB-2040 TaxID=2692859 RepID=UPI001686546E|nr:response regulator transcription factor [Pseudanabaena sp. FACHB-2040]MBD2256128.1 response regulator transcription factor [Pseudanabaena sp. FACHB-2040]
MNSLELSPQVQPNLRVGLGRVLIVEDEELIRETVALGLAEEGFEILVAEDGLTALEMLGGTSNASRVNHPEVNLVILDLMLPGMNGLDLCRLLRHQGIDVPILILSAKGTETDRVVGLEIGADDYLTKPFGMRELIARCRALLRRHRGVARQESDPVLRFQEISLHPKECRAFLRGEELSLSPKEFRILELFMSQPRRVWSRDQIIDQVWGHDFMGDNKTVDVHIRWIREKLEIDPSNPQYLKTVRGFGYRLG